MTGRCGTYAGYEAHVKGGTPPCDPCRRAGRQWTRDYRKRVYLAGGKLQVDGTATRRRLQALACMGWTNGLLAEALGTVHQQVYKWARAEKVYPSTAARIAALYDELWDVPGPSARTRARAQRMGWAPPLAWDDDTIDDPRAQANRGLGSITRRKPVDEIAVQRAMHGDAVTLTAQERTEAVRRLRARGLSSAQIAALLHIEKRSVERIKRKAS